MSGFDTYLYLLDGPSGSVLASDDDDGPGRGSLIVHTFDTTGNYEIAAEGYGGSEYGSYELQLELLGGGGVPDPTIPSPGGDHVSITNVACSSNHAYFVFTVEHSGNLSAMYLLGGRIEIPAGSTIAHIFPLEKPAYGERLRSQSR